MSFKWHMYLRSYVAGIATAGVSCFTFHHVSLEKRQPHFDFEEQVHTTKLNKVFKYGKPKRSPDILVYKQHALSYDQQRRIPLWVAEYLCRDNLNGSASRNVADFKPDPSIEALFSSSNEDYRGSGWSRGHMAPAGDYKNDQEAMNATFLLTNIVPQDASNNSGYWNQLEIFCRDLTSKYDHVRIFTGPLFLPQRDNKSDGKKKYITYEVIGTNDVAVPTHLFKIILCENEGSDQPVIGAFVIPNKPISSETLLAAFQVPVEFIESRVGVRMFPLLDHRRTHNLCSRESCDFRLMRSFEQFAARQKSQAALAH